jgi:hypothetical protein
MILFLHQYAHLLHKGKPFAAQLPLRFDPLRREAVVLARRPGGVVREVRLAKAVLLELAQQGIQRSFRDLDALADFLRQLIARRRPCAL